jgi:hypothetical protein
MGPTGEMPVTLRYRADDQEFVVIWPSMQPVAAGASHSTEPLDTVRMLHAGSRATARSRSESMRLSLRERRLRRIPSAVRSERSKP